MLRFRRSILPLLLVLLLVAPAAVTAAEPIAPALTQSIFDWLRDWLMDASTARKSDRQEFLPDADPNGVSSTPLDESESDVQSPSGTGDMGPDPDPNG